MLLVMLPKSSWHKYFTNLGWSWHRVNATMNLLKKMQNKTHWKDYMEGHLARKPTCREGETCQCWYNMLHILECVRFLPDAIYGFAILWMCRTVPFAFRLPPSWSYICLCHRPIALRRCLLRLMDSASFCDWCVPPPDVCMLLETDCFLAVAFGRWNSAWIHQFIAFCFGSFVLLLLLCLWHEAWRRLPPARFGLPCTYCRRPFAADVAHVWLLVLRGLLGLLGLRGLLGLFGLLGLLGLLSLLGLLGLLRLAYAYLCLRMLSYVCLGSLMLAYACLRSPAWCCLLVLGWRAWPAWPPWLTWRAWLAYARLRLLMHALLLMVAFVCICLLRLAYACLCLAMFAYVYACWCLVVLAYAGLSLFSFAYASVCLLMLACACSCLLMLISGCLCLLTLPYVWSCLLGLVITLAYAYFCFVYIKLVCVLVCASGFCTRIHATGMVGAA